MFKNVKQLESFFEKRNKFGIKPGLDRVSHLLALMDHPEKKIKAIHVAGTNGKGSTITFIKNALIHNDYKVGTFISPSLDGVAGHIFCNDEKITNKQLITLINVMHPAIKKLDEMNNHPTAFEIITVLALMYFAEHVDIALIEAGMGGREDTTNCFKPILSIITNIDLDHTSFLGETVQEIAHHKAGIIKANVPVIIGEVDKSTFTVLQNEAQLRQAPIYRLFDDFTYTSVKQEDNDQSFKWSKQKEYPLDISLHMHGIHQVKNSSLAIMALVYLKKQGYSIDYDKVLARLKQTIVPGRFEVVHTDPKIILDGAHNPASVAAFIETVLLNHQATNKHLIFAAFKDKDLQQMLEQLLPHFTEVTFTTFDHPRAACTRELYELIADNHPTIHLENNWQAILDKISQAAGQKQPDYYITGSLNFIADVRKYVKG